MRRLEMNTSVLSIKLDRILFLISNFLPLSPLSLEDATPGEKSTSNDTRIPIDIEDWTRYAGKLVSSGETISGTGRRFSAFPEDTEEAQFQQFFHERWDNQEDEYLMRLRERPRKSPLENPEQEFIPFLRHRAEEAFDAKDYTAAKLSLQKILYRSPRIYGEHFEWRDETLRMLVVVCIRLREWDEAKKYVSQEFKGRDQTLEDLAMDSYLHGKRDDTREICLTTKFRGREAILQLLAGFYVREKQWNPAKQVLSALMFTTQPLENVRHQRLHTLAEVYFALKEFESAKKCCNCVFEERQKLLDVLYYQSVELLGRISDKLGDRHLAAFYKTHLETESHGEPPLLCRCLIPSLCSTRTVAENCGRNQRRNTDTTKSPENSE